MLFGVTDDFAIECFVDRVPAMRRSMVIGRMCVWCGGEKIGDLDDVNVLDVQEGFFRGMLGSLGQRSDVAIDSLPDVAAFEFLDRALYADDDHRSYDQVRSDSDRFSKFDFLTNWGESFVGNKAFILRTTDGLRVLYRRGEEPVTASLVTEQGLRQAVQGFLAWVADQRLPGEVTESEWLASTDVEGMVDWLRKTDPGLSKKGGRRFRLFDCACCRRIWPLMPDDRCRRAVEVAEQYADGRADDGELAVARQAAKEAANAVPRQPGQHSPAGYAAWAAVYSAWATTTASAASNVRTAVYFTADLGVEAARLEHEAQVTLVRDLFGNPFRPVSITRSCLTPTVVDLARRIYDTSQFDLMPELADRLEEAGCVHLDVLDHCRGPGPHARGCWALDLLLGKE